MHVNGEFLGMFVDSFAAKFAVVWTQHSDYKAFQHTPTICLSKRSSFDLQEAITFVCYDDTVMG